jgi:hypothetical protein
VRLGMREPAAAFCGVGLRPDGFVLAAVVAAKKEKRHAVGSEPRRKAFRSSPYGPLFGFLRRGPDRRLATLALAS